MNFSDFTYLFNVVDVFALILTSGLFKFRVINFEFYCKTEKMEDVWIFVFSLVDGMGLLFLCVYFVSFFL